MATLPTPAQLVEQAKKNAKAVGKIVKDNPQLPGSIPAVPSPQGGQQTPGGK